MAVISNEKDLFLIHAACVQHAHCTDSKIWASPGSPSKEVSMISGTEEVM